MFRLDLGVVRLFGEALRGSHRFLCFLRVLVEVHVRASSFCSASKCARCSGVTSRGSWTSAVA